MFPRFGCSLDVPRAQGWGILEARHPQRHDLRGAARLYRRGGHAENAFLHKVLKFIIQNTPRKGPVFDVSLTQLLLLAEVTP